jgi:hypothetical protein
MIEPLAWLTASAARIFRSSYSPAPSCAGKRSLNVPRNAIVHFTATSPAQNWWEQKLDGPVVNTQQLLQMPDHTVANVLAICGSITRQEKTQGMQVTIISGMWLNDDLL